MWHAWSIEGTRTSRESLSRITAARLRIATHCSREYRSVFTQPELAIGAIASGGIVLREPRIAAHLDELDVPFEQLAEMERAEAAALVGGEADEMVILKTPADRVAIGQWYENFEQVEDEQVRELLDHMRRAPRDASAHP